MGHRRQPMRSERTRAILRQHERNSGGRLRVRWLGHSSVSSRVSSRTTAGRRMARSTVDRGSPWSCCMRRSVLPAASAPCEDLNALTLPGGAVTGATIVASGAFSLLDGPGGPVSAPFASLPAFCRVTATLKPTSDSDIRIEVWLPVAGWNGKFQAVGNGAWAGVIPYTSLARAVAAGYASAGTDTGHTGNTAAFAPGHPEKVIDMAYRAVHEMTVHAKAIIAAYYGNPPTLSFWNACSTGGRQGVTSAVRYPTDFDVDCGRGTCRGLDASARRAHRHESDGEQNAGTCHSAGEVRDGSCRRPERVRRARRRPGWRPREPASVFLRSPSAPMQRSGRRRMPDGAAGGDRAGLLLAGDPPGHRRDRDARSRAWDRALLGDARRTSAARQCRRGVPATSCTRIRAGIGAVSISRPISSWAIAIHAGVLASADANLKPFFDRGGKLLMYHGWSDPQIPPGNTIAFFDRVVETAGREAVGTSVQLYMVPGMNHCGGGSGTDPSNPMRAVEQWVESGEAPSRITASRIVNGIVERTRPLCPYGQVPSGTEKATPNEAASFACVAAGWRHPRARGKHGRRSVRGLALPL